MNAVPITRLESYTGASTLRMGCSEQLQTANPRNVPRPTNYSTDALSTTRLRTLPIPHD